LRGIVEGSRLRERAYEVIKEAILKLELAPGQPINEAELAGQLNVSRTPIRDALLQLEAEGFVVIQPFRGAFVAELTAQDTLDVFALRELLECAAVSHAAQRFDAQEIAALQEWVLQMEQALDQGRLSEYSTLSDQFHRRIIDRFGNRRVTHVLNNLSDHIKRLRTMALLVSPSREFLKDYRAILEGIQAHNPAAAEKAMKAHLNRVLRTLVSERAGS